MTPKQIMAEAFRDELEKLAMKTHSMGKQTAQLLRRGRRIQRLGIPTKFFTDMGVKR